MDFPRLDALRKAWTTLPPLAISVYLLAKALGVKPVNNPTAVAAGPARTGGDGVSFSRGDAAAGMILGQPKGEF